MIHSTDSQPAWAAHLHLLGVLFLKDWLIKADKLHDYVGGRTGKSSRTKVRFHQDNKYISW
jgi:hypothetical protein